MHASEGKGWIRRSRPGATSLPTCRRGRLNSAIKATRPLEDWSIPGFCTAMAQEPHVPCAWSPLASPASPGPRENALLTICHRVIVPMSYFLIDLTPKFLRSLKCPAWFRALTLSSLPDGAATEHCGGLLLEPSSDRWARSFAQYSHGVGTCTAGLPDVGRNLAHRRPPSAPTAALTTFSGRGSLMPP